MDAKILRTLIYLFLGLIALFFVLMLVNLGGAWLRPAPPEQKRDNVADSYMQGHLTNPVIKQNIPPDPAALPSDRSGLSPAAAGAMMVVKNKNFGGVAERQKDPMTELRERTEERSKPAPIALKGPSAKVFSPSMENRGEVAPSGGAVPELGRGAAQEGVTLIKVEVKQKLFGSADLWKPFCAAHGIKGPAPDFSASDMLILVPGGDYPAGILSVESVEKGPKETLVKYRVNPLAMAAGSEEELRERYASVPVPKKKTVRLLQVP